MNRNYSVGSVAWRVAAIVAYLVMIAVNGMANSLPLFGRTTGEVSDLYPTLFTPAAFTFAVWGVIYFLLGGFVVFQALPARRAEELLVAVRPLFVLSSVLNVLWLISWHSLALPLSELLMVGLLGVLVLLYLRVGAWRGSPQGAERWWVALPFSIYLGWISVATIANTAILLVSRGFDGGALAPLLTLVVIAAAMALGLWAIAARRDVGYALVVGWGLAGIAAARVGGVRPDATVGAAASLAAGVLAVVAVAALLARRRRADSPAR